MNFFQCIILTCAISLIQSESLQKQVLVLEQVKEDHKIKTCIQDAQMAQKDLKEILDMLQTKWDAGKFLRDALDLSVRVQEIYETCRSISAQDIFDYYKEEKKECFEKIQTITIDLSTIFVKWDVTLQEILDAASDFEKKFPEIYQVCFAQLQ